MVDDALLGEIRMFGGPDVPKGWTACNGQILQIRELAPLFSLLGTTFGGDGQTTFAVPDLRARFPIHLTDSLPVGTLAPAVSTEFGMSAEKQPFAALTYCICVDGLFPSQS